MKKAFISGFTIVRNAIRYDYPVVESITSILPVVDEFVVLVGNSDDDTLNLIHSIASPKIKIFESVWDDSLREGGKVLAVETDKAKALINPKADWCFYIQADEVVHEQYLPAIEKACSTYLDNKRIEGLLFSYVHFYGNYHYTANSRKWYRNEIRIVRNLPEIHSYRDAQGFRLNGEKLHVQQIPASIYHYGWVKDPRHQQAKQKSFHKMWHSDEWVQKHVAEADTYDYAVIDSLKPFTGTHPSVMTERLKRLNWEFNWNPARKKFRLKEWVLYQLEQLTGKRWFEYRNYKKIG